MKKRWQRKRLGDVLKVQNGYAFDSEGFNPTKGMPLIRIRSLKPGTETETHFDGDYDKKYVVKAGDLLIGMDGEFGCYEWKGEPALLNQRVCRLQGFSGELIPRFLFYGVNDYLKAIEYVTGYATVKHISSKQILAIEFPIPPLDEQQRIVGLLDDAFEDLATAQTNAEKNKQNARALFESYHNSIFKKRRKGWVEKPLGEVCEYVNGKAHEQCIDINGCFIVINSKFISTEGEIIKRSNEALLLLQPGDITMVLSDVPKGKALAKCFLVEKANTYTLNQRICLLRSAHIHTKFLFYQLNRNKHFLSFDNGENQTNLRLNQVLSCPLFIPPITEQETITNNLDAISEETKRLTSLYERKLVAVDALKKSLLNQAFTAEL